MLEIIYFFLLKGIQIKKQINKIKEIIGATKGINIQPTVPNPPVEFTGGYNLSNAQQNENIPKKLIIRPVKAPIIPLTTR
ncbi:hypothetical protein [Wenyingzhuangia aestuarii]|uniref:hypothetical protein n=1 Tax=Wenyingzhuangia aestuarii TaxID=1647582 RepID=UPI001ADB96A8|nr:hypothetical protein [Wenyingzhuangia aestuarii]